MHIDIAARVNEIELVVRDDGYGGDTRLRDSLFEPFSRAARAGVGTGLGLYIVRRIAEETAGRV